MWRIVVPGSAAFIVQSGIRVVQDSVFKGYELLAFEFL